MVFSSLLFLFRFLPAVLLLYYILPKKARNTVLFLVSLFFYAWGEPVYVLLMLATIVLDYILGRLVGYYRAAGRMHAAKISVAAAAVINLGFLGFFKYWNFLLENFNLLFHTSVSPVSVTLPIGISFYTFQTLSYVIDVYRGDAEVQKNFFSFGAFVTLFPQLIAGPIVRYKTIADALDSRTETKNDFTYGIFRFTEGLGKKVLLANNIGLLYDEISAMQASQTSVLTAWLGIAAYAFQIYFDFSGYSDMAIGLGAMFGFHFLENFNYPYTSRSCSEFWRRWHISLGTWFREYVYIPLGGNRVDKVKQIRNLAIVWLLTGIWHGAALNFLAWGAYYGLILILEKFVYGRYLERLPAFLQHLYTMVLVLIGWVIFAFDSFQKGFVYLGYMFGAGGVAFANRTFLYELTSYAVVLVILILVSTPLPKQLVTRLHLATTDGVPYMTDDEIAAGKQPEQVKTGRLAGILQIVFVAAVFLMSVAYLVDASYNPFLYFRF